MKRTLMVLALALATIGMSSAEGLPIKFGGGFGFLTFTNTQNLSFSGTDGGFKDTASFWGASAYVDITKYFTVRAGIWKGLGDEKETGTGVFSGTFTETNNLTELELGASARYPFSFGDSFEVAPKAGINMISYLSGDLGGSELTTTESKQFFGPVSVTLGMDADWQLGNNITLRIPLDLGIALNAKNTDNFYSGYAPLAYESSSVISFSTGIAVLYQF